MISKIYKEEVERLRELYLLETPDKDGMETQSISFNWGKFILEPKAAMKFYLQSQGAIEEQQKSLALAMIDEMQKWAFELERHIDERLIDEENQYVQQFLMGQHSSLEDLISHLKSEREKIENI